MRHLLIFGILLTLVGCTISPSKPKSATSALNPAKGAIIFSTTGEQESSKFGTGFFNVANEVIGLGLASETRVFQIAFKKNSQDKNQKKEVVLGHSYKTAKSALKTKWHIIPLDPGSYSLSHVMYEDHIDLKRTTSLPKGLISFEVSKGEWVYLGSFITALRKLQTNYTYTTNQYGWNSSVSSNKATEFPALVDVQWNENEAKKQADFYTNYPDVFKTAKYNEERLDLYLKRIDELSID